MRAAFDRKLPLSFKDEATALDKQLVACATVAS